jgi:uncharacterized protein (TIGR03435 family)
MGNRARDRSKLLLKAALAAGLIGTMWPQLLSQRAAAQVSAAQSPIPEWQTAAGGQMEFDVASVKPNTTAPSRDTITSNIPLGPQDMFAPTGGLLSATNFPLLQYIVFAYKLTPNQVRDARSQLPKWATTDRFDIQARAAGNPTKDQYRLMMQALLADRFKLAVHFETRQLPVLVLVLDKPGKLGPQLRPHPADSPCSTAAAPGGGPGPQPTVAGGFPEICGVLVGVQPSAPGRFRGGARNVPIAMLTSMMSIPQITGVDRPVLDKSGLSGTYDFVIEFTPQLTGPLPPGANFQPDPNGPTFMEALKEQLGLKLESQTGPVDVIVVDHVEPPSEN